MKICQSATFIYNLSLSKSNMHQKKIHKRKDQIKEGSDES